MSNNSIDQLVINLVATDGQTIKMPGVDTRKPEEMGMLYRQIVGRYDKGEIDTEQMTGAKEVMKEHGFDPVTYYDSLQSLEDAIDELGGNLGL